MEYQSTSKSKTLAIVGFGREGQAIYNYYKDQFDQIYIFDEKVFRLDIQDLRL